MIRVWEAFSSTKRSLQGRGCDWASDCSHIAIGPCSLREEQTARVLLKTGTIEHEFRGLGLADLANYLGMPSNAYRRSSCSHRL